jgi:hypothetical protein
MRGTGTSVLPSAFITRYSRSTWCADLRSWPGGFLRSTYLPLGEDRMKVGLDWPVGVLVASMGPRKPGSWVSRYVASAIVSICAA